MSDTAQRAEKYLAKVPPATEGNRNDSLNKLAFQLLERFDLSSTDFERLLLHWAGTCNPPITDREALSTIHSAWSGAHSKGAIGSKAKVRTQHTPQGPRTHSAPQSAPKPPAKRYDLADSPADLPQPIEDGARELLRACFEAGEGVRIVNAKLADDGGEIPDGAGPCLSREEWLRKLDAGKGNPNAIFSSSKRTGIYISINPLKIGGSKDADVTAFRHALVEFDEQLSPQEQWNLYQKSGLPCTAIIYSGGKSVHAWVKIDAKDRQEYDQRVRALYDHFEGAGCKLDPKNKNPSRLSRLPYCIRFNKRQELLALHAGKESFSEWLAEQQTEGTGKVLTAEYLLNLKTAEDENNVLGNRWLCRGGSCLIIAPSGVGKSSLSMQASILWAVGRPFLGIKPGRPRKVLIVQAENDDADTAEMMQGVYGSIELFTEEEDARLYQNLIVVRDTTHTGFEFTQAVRRLIDRHKPEIVVLDPLLSFIGADISRQEVCSQFLRNWLNPIAEATGVIWICVHHTGKPSTDPRAKKHWQASDFSYSGLGSSELTNWTRATMILEQAGENTFRLRLTKRGGRAGATHPNGDPTQTLWLKHATGKIFWEQLDPPAEPEDKKPGKAGRPGTSWSIKEFCATLTGEALTRGEIKTRACKFGSFSGSHFEQRIWSALKKDWLQPDGKRWKLKIENATAPAPAEV